MDQKNRPVVECECRQAQMSYEWQQFKQHCLIHPIQYGVNKNTNAPAAELLGIFGQQGTKAASSGGAQAADSCLAEEGGTRPGPRAALFQLPPRRNRAVTNLFQPAKGRQRSAGGCPGSNLRPVLQADGVFSASDASRGHVKLHGARPICAGFTNSLEICVL